MGSHFKQEEPGKKAGRRAVVAVVLVVVVAVLAFVGIQLVLGSSEAPANDAGGDSEAAVSTAEDSSGDSSEGGNGSDELPFSIAGIDASADLLVAGTDSPAIELAGEWTFGGDYTVIGSFPIDATTVFGSSSSDPVNVSTYVASLIGSDGGVTALEDVQTGNDTIYEPQDGTGDASRIVWRSSALSYVPSTGIDDWRLQVWTQTTGEATVLGTAEELNGTSDTPMLDGEIVPTANATQAFFASMRSVDDSWVPTVLAYDLSGASEPVVVGEGSYPAATEGGALWAGDGTTSGSDALFQGLYSWDGTDSTKVFSLESDDGTWGISGVWATDERAVVCFSNSDTSKGCYIGIWSADFSGCVAWIYSAAPRAIGSMNANWLVWGSGSESDNAGMYAYKFETGELFFLGNAVGYSRPVIAEESDVVLLPESDGVNAIVFHVGTIS